ncbi:MAG: RNA-guided pseudouridylation complex pseudouridine synthase subunit Cbf5 [Candidatus Thermoplasmatota archaeon]|jgi:H/ACA ribonucleoprotein complex subunit 4|nr:RNA-guided pseudouridylation complex pseudouridine synthase subunit Cbf5 [Candidatus Thermoplasmatota archaeon]
MFEETYAFPFQKNRKRIIKVQAKTNLNYGKSPNERSVKELLSNGFVILDKPSGPTSHQIDSWIKNFLKVEKVGHGGTLDPNATGVLPIAIGNATRAIQVLLLTGKEYVGIMKLHKDIDSQKIKETLNSFVGEITQIPPVRSAVKRVKRKRKIYYLEVIEIKDRDVLFRVGCQAGTYIRTLVVDAGKKLHCGAHLAELRRTKVGPFREEESVILQDLKDAYIFWKEDGNEKEIRSMVHPMEKLIDFLPKIVIRDSAVDALCHGASLAIPGVVEVDSDIKKGDVVAILTLKGEGVALAKTLLSTEEIIQKDSGVCANLERVLMNKGTYPPIWKKT